MSELPGIVPRKLLFRPDEVAPLIGVSTRTVKRWMGQGVFGRIKQTPSGARITYDGLAAYYHDKTPPAAS
ncbi:MAG: hypothetical protein LDL07_03225 [Desulfarculus sp.]|nr:hypothetical protein [Desulfarculus sp.]